MALIYNASFNSQTRTLSLLDKAGNVISSCEVPSKSNELTLTATADNSSVKLTKNGTLSNAYEVNVGSGWVAYTFGTIVNLNAGQNCKWRCSAHPTTQSASNYIKFVMTGTIEASGNVNSMLSSDFESLTSLSGYNYAFMRLFDGCTALTKAPELPATTLSTYCYHYMFTGCTGLTQAPELPATTLVAYCSYNMFKDCTSLAEVRMEATDTSATYCLLAWLSGVSATGDFYCNPNTSFQLGGSGIPVGWDRFVLGAEDTGTTTTMYHNGSTETVRVGTSSYGTCYSARGWAGFKTLADMHKAGYTFGSQSSLTMYYYDLRVVSAYSCTANQEDGFTETMYSVGGGYKDIATQNTNGYYLTSTPYSGLTLRATSDNSSVKLNKVGDIGQDWYAVNTGNGWRTYNFGEVINLNNGEGVLFRQGYTYATPRSTSNYIQFVMTGTIEALGSLRSMSAASSGSELYGTYRFYSLFSGCTSLTRAPITLPWTNISGNNYCYKYMFLNCTSLTQAPPSLPATNVGAGCYEYMFSGCTSLTQVPSLTSATHQNSYCYRGMFSGCTSLTQAPSLPTSLGGWCYESMFSGCTSLTQAPSLPATQLNNDCYKSMFSGCKSLTQAPSLPATNLYSSCYSQMFSGCTLLNEVKIRATKTATGALSSWLSNVAATGDFYCDPNSTIFSSGASGIPVGWNRWVLGAEDTGNTTTMYHNGVAETVRVGTSSYGTCYSAQGWAGFKTLAQMHEAGYTLQAPVPTTMYHNGSTTSVDTIEANGADGFTKDMYILNGALNTLAQMHDLGYTLQEPVPTTMYHNGSTTSVDTIEANGADGFTEDMYVLNSTLKTLAEMHALGYTFGAQSSLTMYHWEDPVSAYSCAASVDDGFTETMYDVGNGYGYLTIAQQNTNGYFLSATPRTELQTPLHFVALENSSVYMRKSNNTNTLYNSYEYSFDEVSWTQVTTNTVIQIPSGSAIYFRHGNTAWKNRTGFGDTDCFVFTGSVEAYGNVLSMLNKNFESITDLTPYGGYTFTNLFNCSRDWMTTANQNALKKLPLLPATTLTNYCYAYMFMKNYQVQKSPELPATTLSQSCYEGIFNTCSSLSEVRIAATTTATDALKNWLANVAASGTVYADPNFTGLPTNSVNGVPSGWTRANINDYPVTP